MASDPAMEGLKSGFFWVGESHLSRRDGKRKLVSVTLGDVRIGSWFTPVRDGHPCAWWICAKSASSLKTFLANQP
jgi:hypothetical protein